MSVETGLDVSEVREVAAAVRRHQLTAAELSGYLAGLNASEELLLCLPASLPSQQLSAEALADYLEQLTR
jgi:hypothetical protein